MTISPLSTNASWASTIFDPSVAIVKDPEFELGVTKIQRSEVSLMTEEEKTVCKNLEMVECDSSAALSSGPDSSG